MTQEEKAKAYDEVVEKLSKLYRDYDSVSNLIDVKEELENIFPELKESEDERIIGNIIATIHLYYGEPLEDEAKEMIAWLERRGQTFNKKDIDDAYLKGVCDAKHEIEKQGEQKPADTEKGAKGNEVEIPISVWSEKNEGMLQTVINRLELSKNRNASEIPYVERCVDWLKSLKDRYTWKPSDEQIDALVSAIDIMNDNRGAGDKKTNLLSGLYHELKAL